MRKVHVTKELMSVFQGTEVFFKSVSTFKNWKQAGKIRMRIVNGVNCIVLDSLRKHLGDDIFDMYMREVEYVSSEKTWRRRGTDSR